MKPTKSRGRIILRNVENLKTSKNPNPCQPAWTAQADMGLNLSQIFKAPFYKAWLYVYKDR